MDMVGKDVENNCSRGNGSPSVADSILELPIANISRVADNIVRGETLWASRNIVSGQGERGRCGCNH